VLTTLSILTLRPGFGPARWALAQMATAPLHWRAVPGLQFCQLLGSGAANGFGVWPNWRRYGLLATWTDATAAEQFFATDALWAAYQTRCAEVWTAFLAPLQGHGAWYGRNPFAEGEAPSPAGRAHPAGPVAVLTRASIRLRQAARFWRYVEPTSRAVVGAPGLRLAIGLGELPLVRQATFSLWDSVAAMQAYAYRHAAHREVVQRTRREGWYSEELFERFAVLGCRGTVDGQEIEISG